jgi:uncharacterized protein (TIGR03435 family)
MKRLTIEDEANMTLVLQGEIRRSEESRYDHRLHGVPLIAEGMSCPEVARLLGDSPRTVEYGCNASRTRAWPDRPVLDRTQVSGVFDFDLKWAADPDTEPGPSLFTAVQEQFGLQLEARKSPIDGWRPWFRILSASPSRKE